MQRKGSKMADQVPPAPPPRGATVDARVGRRSRAHREPAIEGTLSATLGDVTLSTGFWDFDPISPTVGQSIRLDSVLKWRGSSGRERYLSRSVATVFAAAASLRRTAPQTAEESPVLIEVADVLTSTLLLGRLTDTSYWASAFQNGVARQEVIPPGHDSNSVGRLAKDLTDDARDINFPDVLLRWDVVEVLALASKLRVETNTTYSDIGLRHLLAATFLTPGGQAGLRDLAWFAEDFISIRNRFVGIATEVLATPRFKDDPGAWPGVLERVLNAPLMIRPTKTEVRPDYAPDTIVAGPDDPIGTRLDAQALADLVLLKAAEPPLAIGLFGPWGSGKSTLMRRLQAEIREQTKAERALPLDRTDDLARARNVIQVEFSAWSFADSDNLWAALTAEVFDQLAVGGIDGWSEKPGADLIASIAARVSRDSVTLNTAAAEAAEHRQSASQFKAQVEAARREKSQATAATLWAMVQKLVGAGAKPSQKAAAAETPQADQSPWEAIRSTLVAAPGEDGGHSRGDTLKAIGGIGKVVAELTARDIPRIRQQFAWALCLAFAVSAGLIFWQGRQFHLPAWLLPGSLIATVAAPTILYGPSFLRLANWYLSARATRIKAAKAAEQKAAKRLREAEAAQADAETRAGQSRRFVETFKTEDGAATSPGLMLQYLLRESEDVAAVRRQIGFINIVRRCFEQLAAVVREMARSKDPAAVDRIVIYIDDLDRCTAAQVVAVLEAVHLLLAFDCFVVVVAVDPAWLKHSLDLHHLQLSGGHGDLDGQPTAEDYLEKIFQVPFQVRPLVDPEVNAPNRFDAYRRYMLHLLRLSDDLGTTQANGVLPGEGSAEDLGTVGSTIDLRKGFVVDGPSRPGDFDAPRRERVTMIPTELRLLLDLGVLAAKSPRAVKRMINIYRLIRVALSPEGLKSFLACDGKLAPPYWSVAFALACEVGLPASVSQDLRRAAHRLPASEWDQLMASLDAGKWSHASSPPPLVKSVIDGLADSGKTDAFTAALNAARNHTSSAPSQQAVRAGLDAVARYSFHPTDR